LELNNHNGIFETGIRFETKSGSELENLNLGGKWFGIEG
jgi:hypothetical protein